MRHTLHIQKREKKHVGLKRNGQSSASKDTSRQCQQKAGGGQKLKMPQYGADKDSLIGNTSDYGDNGNADNVDDGDDYHKKMCNKK